MDKKAARDEMLTAVDKAEKAVKEMAETMKRYDMDMDIDEGVKMFFGAMRLGVAELTKEA